MARLDFTSEQGAFHNPDTSVTCTCRYLSVYCGEAPHAVAKAWTRQIRDSGRSVQLFGSAPPGPLRDAVPLVHRKIASIPVVERDAFLDQHALLQVGDVAQDLARADAALRVDDAMPRDRGARFRHGVQRPSDESRAQASVKHSRDLTVRGHTAARNSLDDSIDLFERCRVHDAMYVPQAWPSSKRPLEAWQSDFDGAIHHRPGDSCGRKLQSVKLFVFNDLQVVDRCFLEPRTNNLLTTPESIAYKRQHREPIRFAASLTIWLHLLLRANCGKP